VAHQTSDIDRGTDQSDGLPLYREELAYHLKHGTDAFYEKFEKAGVGDVLDPSRVNACKRSRWRLPWQRD
jgi:hypothetical protein